MSTIKRYHIDVDLWERDACVVDREDGEYILFSDHVAEVERLKAELVVWAEERLIDEQKGVNWDMRNSGDGVEVCKALIEYLNR